MHATRASPDDGWTHTEHAERAKSVSMGPPQTGMARVKYCQLATCIQPPGSVIWGQPRLGANQRLNVCAKICCKRKCRTKTYFSPRLYQVCYIYRFTEYPYFVSWNKRPFSRICSYALEHLEGNFYAQLCSIIGLISLLTAAEGTLPRQCDMGNEVGNRCLFRIHCDPRQIKRMAVQNSLDEQLTAKIIYLIR